MAYKPTCATIAREVYQTLLIVNPYMDQTISL